MTEAKAALKPCPFCGETPDNLAWQEGETFRWLLFGCGPCGSYPIEVRRRSHYSDPPSDEDFANAAKEWNTRPLEDRDRPLIEAGRQAVEALKDLVLETIRCDTPGLMGVGQFEPVMDAAKDALASWERAEEASKS